jgi:hypothetical protein
MKTYFSKFFYFLGELIPFKKNFCYGLYRRMMLISICLDIKNIVWESEIKRQTKKRDFIAKLKLKIK